MLHFTEISQMTKHFGMGTPEHPLFLPNRPSKELIAMAHEFVNQDPIKSDFYTIALKRIVKGSIAYGRTKYDCQKGVLMFVAPGQVSVVENAKFEYGGFSIMFHKDFLQGYDLYSEINKFHLFDYTTNEALHLSAKEESTLQHIYKNIEREYFNIKDEFSKELIVSNLHTFLKYSNRYYKRQFLYREHMNKSLYRKFRSFLKTYFEQNDILKVGGPTLDMLSKELSVSKRYLNDSIKYETGKTAKQQLNLFLIEKAKNLLLTPEITISEIAFKLGFNYPEYFSRLFKKKTGMSPTKFVEHYVDKDRAVFNRSVNHLD